MAPRRRSGNNDSLNAWPGYVDALSTLLMVIIFVLLVFVLAQAFLSVALSGRDQALDRLNRQMAELSEMLALERGQSADLRLSVAQVNRDLQAAVTARDQLAQQLAALQADQEKLTADRDALKTERDRLSARLADAALQTQAAQSRAEDLQGQLAEAARRTEALGQETAAAVAPLAEARRQLTARAAELADVHRQAADTEAKLEQANRDLAARTADIDSLRRQLAETIRQADAKAPEMARLAEQVRTLAALRDDLEKQAREAAARAATDAQAQAAAVAQAAEEKRLGDTARAQLGVAEPAGGRVAGATDRLAEGARSGRGLGPRQRREDRRFGQPVECGAGEKSGGTAALPQRLLRQAARGAGQPARHPGGRRPVRVPE